MNFLDETHSAPGPSFAARVFELLRRYRLVVTLLAICLLFLFYLDNVSTNPPGFYIDESAISYNAYCVAHTGAGEFGDRFPLFFPVRSEPVGDGDILLPDGIGSVSVCGLPRTEKTKLELGHGGSAGRNVDALDVYVHDRKIAGAFDGHRPGPLCDFTATTRQRDQDVGAVWPDTGAPVNLQREAPRKIDPKILSNLLHQTRFILERNRAKVYPAIPGRF